MKSTNVKRFLSFILALIPCGILALGLHTSDAFIWNDDDTVDKDTLDIRQINTAAPSESLYKQEMVSSPDMAALARNISCPINYCTGTPQINIPLYTIKSGSLTLPISLTYNASGIRVDDVPGVVGQGWSLTGIPTLSRQVKGHIDYNFACEFDRTTGVSSSSAQAYTYITGLLDNNLLSGLDEQPDEYYYQLSDKSGMFMYLMEPTTNAGNRHYFSLPHNDIKINLDTSGKYFILTDDDGTVYRFNGGGDMAEISNWNQVVGWKASSMVAANEIDSIHFECSSISGNSINQHNDVYTVVDHFTSTYIEHYPRNATFTNYLLINNTEPEVECKFKAPIVYITTDNSRSGYQVNANGLLYSDGAPTLSPLGFQGSVNTTSSNPSEISFQGGTVLFGYSLVGYIPKLSRLTVKNDLNEVVKTIDFSYDNYNGNQRVYLKSVSIKSDSGDIMEEYKFDYYYPEWLPSSGDRRVDFWGYYNGPGVRTTLVPRMLIHASCDSVAYGNMYYNNKDVYIGADDFYSRAANETYMKYGSLKSITYPTGSKDEFLYEANQVRFDDTQSESDFHITDHLLPVSGKTNTYQVGGLRIRQIRTYNDGDSVNYRTFAYNDDGTGKSAIHESCNYFVTEKTKYYYYYYLDRHNTVSSHFRFYNGIPLVPLTFHNGSIVMYGKVTEYNGRSESDNSGKTVYTYNVPDYVRRTDDALMQNQTKYADWKYGHLLSKTIYKKNSNGYKKIQKEEYNYDWVKYVGNVVAGEYRINNIINYPDDGTIDPFPNDIQYQYEGGNNTFPVYAYLLNSMSSKLYDDNENTMITSTNYTHGIDLCTLVTREETTLNNSNSYIQEYQYPYHYSNTTPYSTMIEKNVISPVVMTTSTRGNSTVIVKTPYNNLFKQSACQTNYNNEGLITRVSYTYDNKGNRTSASKDGKENVVYLYGYSNQYVIAIIENATYNQVQSALSSNVIASISSAVQPTTAQWNTINNLRTSHHEWHVTTVKYNPLVGVSSITDPTGTEMRYVYDDLGRLISKSQVINDTERTLETYEYHYIPNP